MFDLESAVKHHGTFIFGSPENSEGINKDGDAYDYSFMTETGKVSYVKKDKDLYLVTLDNTISGNIEIRNLSLDQLTKWFYELSDNYFNKEIKDLTLEEKSNGI
jgi:hypothetical protein